MRRLVVIVLATVALLALSVGAALAHEQSPPGEGDGVGFIPAAGQGHAGIQCANDAGAPPFPDAIPLSCPASPFQD